MMWEQWVLLCLIVYGALLFVIANGLGNTCSLLVAENAPIKFHEKGEIEYVRFVRDATISLRVMAAAVFLLDVYMFTTTEDGFSPAMKILGALANSLIIKGHLEFRVIFKHFEQIIQQYMKL